MTTLTESLQKTAGLNYPLPLFSEASAVDTGLVKCAYSLSGENWGEMNLFQGDFINFGYWKKIPFFDKPITLAERVASARALYELTTAYSELQHSDCVLELGSGRGIGAIHTYNTFNPKRLFGIDLTPDQVRIASQLKKTTLGETSAVKFYVDNALFTEFENTFFDKIYSVEMVQHLTSANEFAKEMYRLLRPQGKLVFSTYLPVSSKATREWSTQYQNIDAGIETATSIHEHKRCLQKAGFTNIQITSIGEHVFHGYDAWARQVSPLNSYTYEHLKAYKQGIVDYYIIIASK
ncbi:MAG: hypothetical protein DHS20C10_13690 [marine bacterium B5-7]|nr:MAG: hypothetical protein DHS20C10_13690 [marine bacterium B5-7]